MIFRLPLLSFTIPCSMGLAGTSFASILRDWRQSRASETSGALDTTRYHLSILFVDDDNSRARVAESIFERVSIHADAGFWLYPHSATVTANSSKALRNVPSEAVNVCAALNLCPSRSSAPGAVLCRSDLDAYDLIICLDDNVANLVLKGLLESADEADFYRPKCRTLSEFLAPDATERGTTEATLDTFMRNRILGLPSHEDLSATLGSDVFLAKPCVEEARLLWNADVTAAVPIGPSAPGRLRKLRISWPPLASRTFAKLPLMRHSVTRSERCWRRHFAVGTTWRSAKPTRKLAFGATKSQASFRTKSACAALKNTD